MSAGCARLIGPDLFDMILPDSRNVEEPAGGLQALAAGRRGRARRVLTFSSPLRVNPWDDSTEGSPSPEDPKRPHL